MEIKEIVLAKIAQGHNEIQRLYHSVPVAELLAPVLANGWSIKDLLAHIAAWEWRCAGLLNQAHDSDLPLRAMPDVDALNLEIYQERREWNWAAVENDFRAAHAALIAAIQAVPAARLADQLIQQTIAEETWLHYEEHLPQLREWQQVVMQNKIVR